MVQVGSIVKISDVSGIVLGCCIKVLGSNNKRIAYTGDSILISVKHVNRKKLERIKYFKRKRYFKGTIHRCLVVRSKVNFKRTLGVYIRFNENSVVLINKKNIPLTNRVKGPILRELCILWPSLGAVSRFMI